MAGRVLSVIPATRFVKSIKPGLIGKPESLLVLDESVRELPLGIIAARATEVRTTISRDPRTDLDKEYTALAGSFAGWSFEGDEPHDVLPARHPSIRAGLLYLPEGIADTFFDQVRERVENGNAEALQFIIVLGVQRANNPRKYSWFANYLVEPSEDHEAPDPLLQLVQDAREVQLQLTEDRNGHSAPQLEDHTVKEKAKAKR